MASVATTQFCCSSTEVSIESMKVSMDVAVFP